MKTKKIKVYFCWIDNEFASIECPYCHKEFTVNSDDNTKGNICVCGKKFALHQQTWVEEIIDEKI